MMNALCSSSFMLAAMTRPVADSALQTTLLIIGLALLVWAINQRRLKLVRRFHALIGLGLGGLFIVGGLDPSLFHFMGPPTYINRIRLLMGLLSFAVLFVTLEAIRMERLQERYAVLWVLTGLFILAGAVFIYLLDFFCNLLGMQYVTFIVAVVVTFLILVTFQFSMELSRFQDDRARLAQRCALLEARVAELEKLLPKNGAAPTNSKDLPAPPPRHG